LTRKHIVKLNKTVSHRHAGENFENMVLVGLRIREYYVAEI
jgi:hypothetical protein